MHKRNLIIVFIVLGINLLTGCSNHKKLNADELFISLHVVGPQLKGTIKYLPPIGEKLPEDAISDSLEFPFSTNVNISRSAYCPRFILNVKKDGKVLGYMLNYAESKSGYFEFPLPDSMLNYINHNIDVMDNNKLDSIYFDTTPGLYDGPEYYVSFKKGDIEKQTYIFKYYKAPKYVARFIDSLYGYFKKTKLSNSSTAGFRRDTLIVKKSEMYWEYISGLRNGHN